MMHISIYICRISRTTVKIVAREERIVKRRVHTQDLEE